MIVDSAQAKSLQIGKFGCYFLCLLKLAEKAGIFADVLYWYDVAEGSAFMGEDPTQRGSRCFVFEPARLLSLLFGNRVQWTMTKESATYEAKADELVVLRYDIPNVSGHFVLDDWDPMGSSITKEKGILVSKRVFRGGTV